MGPGDARDLVPTCTTRRPPAGWCGDHGELVSLDAAADVLGLQALDDVPTRSMTWSMVVELLVDAAEGVQVHQDQGQVVLRAMVEKCSRRRAWKVRQVSRQAVAVDVLLEAHLVQLHQALAWRRSRSTRSRISSIGALR